MRRNTIVLGTLFVSTMLARLCSAQNTGVDWYSFTTGYQGWETGNTAVRGVVGQDFTGVSRQSNSLVASGFLAFALSGGSAVSVEHQDELPTAYALAQNYPNPFNPSTTIHFELPSASRVTLKVYNVLGQEVLTVLDEEKAPGRYDVMVDASALSSGAYFYRLQAGDPASGPGRQGDAFMQVRKFLLLR